MNLRELHIKQGAELAADDIPLHYGDQHAEYRAALERAVLMDRSHEGRLLLNGADRFELPQRMSTNDVLNMAEGEGRATIFTNPNGRILERATIYNRGETALVIAEAGRGLHGYLQRNIFFNDKVTTADISAATNLFALHGAAADSVIEGLLGIVPEYGVEAKLGGANVFIGRKTPVSVAQWIFVAPAENAADVWNAIIDAGRAHGLMVAGSLTYNALRIRAGRPGVGCELSIEYIPLEIGLWDEISFKKGCYTGQEIIARMESRGRLARTMVTLRLSAPVQAPADLFHEGRKIGTLTSAVTTPDGEHLGIGVVKVATAQRGLTYNIGEDVTADVLALAGVQPAALSAEDG